MAPAYASRFLGRIEDQKNQQINPGSRPPSARKVFLLKMWERIVGKTSPAPGTGQQNMKAQDKKPEKPATRGFERDLEPARSNGQNKGSDIPRSWLSHRHYLELPWLDF